MKHASKMLPFAAMALAILPAHADPTYSFTLTDLTNGPATVSFDLNASAVSATVFPGNYEASDMAGTLNGSAATFDLDLAQGDILTISDPGAGFFVDNQFSSNFFTENAGTPPVSFQATTAIGQANCTAALQSLFGHAGTPTTMAFFQVQSPVVFSPCDQVSLDVAPVATAVSVSPEPASLWLMATGALGVVGVMRRRLWA